MDLKMEAGRCEGIPLDVIFDILTRLPVKTLVRFRCVSKLWLSIISSQSFITSFMARSLARPSTLLITFRSPRNLSRLLFSAPNQEEDYPNHDFESESPTASATHHLTLSGFVHFYVSLSINGLVCVKIGSLLRVCNPSTREFITLPEPRSQVKTPPGVGYYCLGMSFFGFDPVHNVHKALETWVFKTDTPGHDMIMEHQVFTLGAYAWKRIDDAPPHRPASSAICINGTLYYTACTSMLITEVSPVLVAFDLSLEEFRLIELPVVDDPLFFYENATLLDVDGCLGHASYENLMSDDRMDLWILDDSNKGTWSKRSCVMPSSWQSRIGLGEYYVAGTISTGEIIIAPRTLSKPFIVFYYDVKESIVRRAEIEGLPEYDLSFPCLHSHIFNNIAYSSHVESIMMLRDLCY